MHGGGGSSSSVHQHHGGNSSSSGNMSSGVSGKASVALWQPPANFALVEAGVYRSAYPREVNVPYLLHKRIRTLVLLSIEKLPATVQRALTRPRNSGGNNSNNNSIDKSSTNKSSKDDGSAAAAVRIVDVAELRSWAGGCEGSASAADDDFSAADVHRALDVVVDTRHYAHPVLLACPTGELQTSVVVGCMRRLQHYTFASICSECELFVSVTRAVRPSVLSFLAEWQPAAYLATSSVIAAALAPQQQQQQHSSSSGGGTGAAHADTVQLASWLTHAYAYRRWCELQCVTTAATRDGDDAKDDGSDAAAAAAAAAATLSPTSAAMLPPPPHVRYARVRNPPALDERSTFTKESLVEDDDD